ncbi:aminomethyltransferase, mitochondrial [Strongylocentrotus purpuratus]|uniref:Aminomethyltransferase n=1 Tax=Strongylocentrotus purpuratus TaxID=7668 RepID=A0A7M7RCV1_STRPU|nr:aminomethyltransferase, mitochondrial [Strongylocentrotus purpuratus]
MNSLRTLPCMSSMVSKLHRLNVALVRKASSVKESELKRTPLSDFHVEHGAKMVPFAGYSMPVQYKSGLVKEHLHCRSSAAIFDVSHMLQSRIYGKDRVKFIESLTVADVEALKPNTGTLSLFINDHGGIIDDLIINQTSEDHLYIVSNAGCADKDQAHIKNKLALFVAEGHDVSYEPITDMALIALQGPAMARVLQAGVSDDLGKLTFMSGVNTSVFGIPGCRVTRCGYTGEDGVEISVPSNRSVELTSTLLAAKDASVVMAGLGARDSLRLEAGLCLYGNDINDDTTPVEAMLGWTIGKRRRQLADFPAADRILQQIKEKPSRKRVGIVSSGPPIRGGEILSNSGELIGDVTSGCPSPSLKNNVIMGYVSAAHAKNGTKVQFQVRKKTVEGVVTKMPFVPTNYYILK